MIPAQSSISSTEVQRGTSDQREDPGGPVRRGVVRGALSFMTTTKGLEATTWSVYSARLNIHRHS